MSKQSNLVNSSQDVTVDASGNVGIGTDSVSNTDTDVLTVGKTSTVHDSVLRVRQFGNGTSAGIRLEANNDTGAGWNSIRSSTAGGIEHWSIGGAGAAYGSLPIRTNGAERMRIDSAGHVTMPYQPSFRASFSSINYNQSGSILPVFNYTEHNRGNHYNTSTGVFTAPVAGSYLFSMGMAAEATSTAAYFVIELMVNGAIDYTRFSVSAVNTGISEGGVSGSVVCSLQANDAVQVLWYTPATISVGRATGGANVWWNGRNYFSGCFLG